MSTFAEWLRVRVQDAITYYAIAKCFNHAVRERESAGKHHAVREKERERERR